VEYRILKLMPQATVGRSSPIERTAEIVNISAGGLQIVDENNLSSDQVIKLRFKIKEREDNINAFARVRWSNFDSRINKYRMGMEFFYLNETDKQIINSMAGSEG
jgi:c-di-GMP-binding flagellar brake protein YcgR